MNNGGCDVTRGACINTLGSFYCACQAGYIGDGIVCSGALHPSNNVPVNVHSNILRDAVAEILQNYLLLSRQVR